MINSDDMVQWAYLLDPCFELTNSEGKPLTGGWIEVYYHGTRDKYYCASDFDGTLHPFKIPLDSLGANIVLADPEFSYDIYVYNRFGTLVMSRYNVSTTGSGDFTPVTGVETHAAHFIATHGAYGNVPAGGIPQGLWLPTYDVDYNGDFIEGASEDYGIMVLKEGTYLIDCLIQFQQDRDDLKNEYGEVRVYTGMEAGYESGSYVRDETGVDADGNMLHFIRVQFIRNVIDEPSNVLFFQPIPPVDWIGCGIYKLSIVKLAVDKGAGYRKYAGGQYISINGQVISATGLQPAGDYALETDLEAVTGNVSSLTEIVSGLEIDMATVSAMMAGKKDLQAPYSASGTSLQTITSVTQDDQGVIHVEYSDIQAQNPLIPGEYVSISGDVISVTGLPSYSEVSAIVGEAVSSVTSILPEEQELVAGEGISITVSGASAIISASGSTFEQVNSDWNATSGVAQILNKPAEKLLSAGSNISITESASAVTISASGLQPAGDYATVDYVDAAVSSVTALFPEEQELVAGDNVTITVTGASAIISAQGGGAEYSAGEYVSISGNTISVTGLEPQVQADWAVSASGDMSYIKNKPEIVNFEIFSVSAGSGISIEEVSGTVFISATGIPEEQELVAGNCVDISVSGASAIISFEPEVTDLVAGDNVSITVSGASAIISASGGGGAPQVNSDWTATSGVAEILNKPDIVPLVAGSNVSITDATTGIVISASGGGSTYTAGSHIDISGDVISVTGIDPQVQADWDQTVSSSVDYIKNKPEVVDMGVVAVSAGTGIAIDEVSGTVFISATGIPEVQELVEGNCMDINVSGASAVFSWMTTAGITDIVSVTALPQNPVPSVLYIIPEAQP